MVDEYKIYLVNNSLSSRTFWVFLAEPDVVVGSAQIFANSAASLVVGSKSPSTNVFTVPIQYIVGAGASNQAVGLQIKIESSIAQNATTTDKWQASYFDVTETTKQGPTLSKTDNSSPADTISIVTNNFNQEQNEDVSWYGSQSFGMKTDAGFIGMSWSPTPGTTIGLKPKPSFWVSTGTFGTNRLADWTQVANKAQQVTVPADFKQKSVTVTLDAAGNLSFKPGAPALADMLGDETPSLAGAAGETAALTYLSLHDEQVDIVEAVRWNPSRSSLAEADIGLTFLTGAITVRTALAASFASFICSGITFTIGRNAEGKTTFSFAYSGDKSAAYIQSILQAGSKIFMREGKE